MSIEKSTEGIIIGTHPSRESDLVLRVITKSQGKVSFLARGGRKSKNKLGTTFDLLDHGIFTTQILRGTMEQLRSFSALPSFYKLRENLTKLLCAALLCETVDHATHEAAHEDGDLYTILLHFFDRIENIEDDKEILKESYFAISEVLTVTGFIDPEKIGEPSLHNLRRLMNVIEEASHKELKTKEEIENICATFGK